jgi:molecular chaperone DnaK
MAADNKDLGRFILDGIPPAPRGMPQVEVTLDVDANGILNVTAKEKATGKSQSITIQGSSGLSKEDIEKMRKDADMHAQEDQKKKDLAEAKNIAEQLIYTSEKALKDAGDKVPADIKSGIEAKVADLKKAKDGQDVSVMKTATEALSSELQKIGQYMAAASANASASQGQPSQNTSAGQGNPGEQAPPPDDTIRDADTKEPGTEGENK